MQEKDNGGGDENATKKRKTKKPRKPKGADKGAAAGGGPAMFHHHLYYLHQEGLTEAQQKVQDQMRRALEEDQYSAKGSIVDTESDDEGDHTYRGLSVRLDKAALQQAVRKHNLLQRLSGGIFGGATADSAGNLGGASALPDYDDYEDEDDDEDDDEEDELDEAQGGSNNGPRRSSNKSKKKKSRRDEVAKLTDDPHNHHHHKNSSSGTPQPAAKDPMSLGVDSPDDDYIDRDGSSIFGATTGQSNATWVECDKCKKWRRLRGVVDEKKLPSRWYCSMNKNDPERARCSAPEEEYEMPHTPETAADARTRKHLRVWVRRLQCNEAYEAKQPTLTRGKKRAVASSSKDPYEWVRCCNPSCGKWRAVLRMMDAKGSVMDRCSDGEFYCVQNVWDEKVASCAAPQENLPAVGCPPWVMQDED